MFPTQGLDDTTLTPEKKYSTNFTKSNRKFSLSLHYNEANSYLLFNGTEIVKFKAKDSEVVVIPLCLGNISAHFSTDNMKRQDYMDIFIFLVLILMLLQLMKY